MIHRVRWLCAAFAAAALVAACGGGGHSSTTTTSTTKVAHTTTSRTTTSTSSTTAVVKSTTSSSVGIPAGNKAALLADCRAAAKTYTTSLASILPANFKSDINSICQKVAAGNISGAKAVARALCNQVAAEMPTGQAKSAVENACKSA
jgi:hypothetical protein